ncbi:MAG: phenylalanine--tRNA ligase subunit beta [Deltaproteobacteria bacterium]|nr:phenylalanine--tRNA ligase subunit beta [Deltaproteobacteria bacterium]
MLVSYNWLKELTPVEISAEELCHRLTMAGLEVSDLVSVGGELTSIRTARIIEISAHPRADRLSLCRVFDGERNFTVVCGARNMRQGDLVALACPGTLLPNGMKIESAEIRGFVSEGMLCSEEELRLEEKSAGIMILPPQIEPGKDLATSLRLKDYVLDIDLTPNRADCLSMVGLAREVAALCDTPVMLPPVDVGEEGDDIAQFVTVTIHEPALCPRYAARYVSDIAIKSSPLWMRRRLELSGIRPINNVVDVTNYILLEWGQPMHAFDYQLLDHGRIVVKPASLGDIFFTLDEKERILDEETLMICDASKYVAIGGIMGGLNTEIHNTTEAVLLESAYFNPQNISRTSKKLGLKTEASLRFEKGVNPETVGMALNRAAQLIAELAEGTVARGVIDAYPRPISRPSPVTINPQTVNRVLGTELSPQTMVFYLNRLGITVEDGDENGLVASIPSHRGDIKEDCDLIEEIARIHGYDHIPATLPSMAAAEESGKILFQRESHVRTFLANNGFSEVITYSFIAPENIEALLVPEDHQARRVTIISNPLSREQSVMRTTLIPGLLTTALENHNHKNVDLRLFEFGRVFCNKKEERLPEEKWMLGGLMCGVRAREAWNYAREEIDFYDIKGVVENIFHLFSLTDVTFHSDSTTPYLHPGISARITINGHCVGELGEIHPHVLDNFEISKKIFIFEIDFGKIIDYLSVGSEKAKPLPKFPPVYRDLALIVERNTENYSILRSIADAHVRYLDEVKLFDVYEGEPLGVGERSLAYRIKFQAPDKSLTDEEVNQLYEEIIAHLATKMKVKLRT